MNNLSGPRARATIPEMKPLATFQNVTKLFGSTLALDGVSFELPRGVVSGILGPAGSGKTTALRILLGLTPPTSGSSALPGIEPYGRPANPGARPSDGFPGWRPGAVGAMVEGPTLHVRATVLENMHIRARAIDLTDPGPEIRERLAQVGLQGVADVECRSLGTAKKRRLGIALALTGRPDLVVLDDPTAGLGPDGAVEIRELIRRLPLEGSSVVLTSGDPREVAAMCDHAVILREGRVVAGGDTLGLLSDRLVLSSGFRATDPADAGVEGAASERTDSDRHRRLRQPRSGD